MNEILPILSEKTFFFVEHEKCDQKNSLFFEPFDHLALHFHRQNFKVRSILEGILVSSKQKLTFDEDTPNSKQMYRNASIVVCRKFSYCFCGIMLALRNWSLRSRWCLCFVLCYSLPSAYRNFQFTVLFPNLFIKKKIFFSFYSRMLCAL